MDDSQQDRFLQQEDHPKPNIGVDAAALLRRVALGAGLSFLLIAAGKALLLALHLFLARLSGAEQYGLYAYAMGWVSLLVLFARMGLDLASLRFIPDHLGRGEIPAARGFMLRSGQAVLAASSLIGLASAAAVFLMGGAIGAELAFTLLLACLLIPLSAATQMIAAFLRALQDLARSLLLLNVLHPLIMLAGAFLLCRALARPLLASDIVILTTAAFTAVMLLGWKWTRDSAALKMPGLGVETRAPEWIRTSARLFLISLWFLVLMQADILILGTIRPPEEVGVYKAAAYTASLCALGLEAVNMLAAPLISELYASRRISELQKALTASARISAATAMPVALMLIIFGEWALGLFGKGFSSGYAPLLILCAGNVFSAALGPAGLMMTMTGHERGASWINGFSAIVNLVLCTVFALKWGAAGAAAATALTWMTRDILSAIYVHRRLGIVPGFAGIIRR